MSCGMQLECVGKGSCMKSFGILNQENQHRESIEKVHLALKNNLVNICRLTLLCLKFNQNQLKLLDQLDSVKIQKAKNFMEKWRKMPALKIFQLKYQALIK